ncbi:hypothetical protein PAMP_006726 [Pampus punctatissimus]
MNSEPHPDDSKPSCFCDYLDTMITICLRVLNKMQLCTCLIYRSIYGVFFPDFQLQHTDSVQVDYSFKTCGLCKVDSFPLHDECLYMTITHTHLCTFSYMHTYLTEPIY